jgi:hypothetical protein
MGTGLEDPNVPEAFLRNLEKPVSLQYGVEVSGNGEQAVRQNDSAECHLHMRDKSGVYHSM